MAANSPYPLNTSVHQVKRDRQRKIELNIKRIKEKNKMNMIKNVIFVVVIMVLVGYNVHIVNNQDVIVGLLMEDVESLAYDEYLFDDPNKDNNTGWEVITQGIDKDEYVIKTPCSITSTTTSSVTATSPNVNLTIPIKGVPIGYSSGGITTTTTTTTTTTITGDKITCEDGGTENCTESNPC